MPPKARPRAGSRWVISPEVVIRGPALHPWAEQAGNPHGRQAGPRMVGIIAQALSI